MTQAELNHLLETNSEPSEFDLLAEREMEVFSLICSKNSPRQICLEMGIEEDEFHRLKRQVQRKLGLKSETELFALASGQTFFNS